jgi:hypothetical protein
MIVDFNNSKEKIILKISYLNVMQKLYIGKKEAEAFIILGHLKSY